MPDVYGHDGAVVFAQFCLPLVSSSQPNYCLRNDAQQVHRPLNEHHHHIVCRSLKNGRTSKVFT